MTTTKVLPLVASLLLGACRGGGEPSREAEPHADGHEPEHAAKGHEEGPSGTVHLDPKAIERNDIRVAEVVMETFGGGVDVPAEVTLAPERIAHVTSVIAGQVVRAEVSVGDEVEKGQVLATLLAVEVGQARSDSVRARSALEAAKANYERQQTLEREGIGSQRALQEARASFQQAQAEIAGLRARLGVYGAGGRSGATVALRAPIAGTVIERHATTGEATKADEPLFVIADTSKVWVMGQVYEQNVGRINVGTQITLRLAAYPDRTWKGTIAYVARVLDDRSRTLPVRVELDNPDGVLRPGLYGTLTVASDSSGAAVPTIPESAVQRVEGNDVVFVPGHEAGEFQTVSVRIGGRDRGRVAIASGLAAGAKVVVSGAFILKSELLKAEMGEGHAH